MPSKRIEAALRRLFEPRAEVPEFDPARERELLGDFDRQFGAETAIPVPRMGVLGFARMHRFALASVAFLIASIGACYAPTQLEVPLGVTVAFVSQGEDPEAVVEEIVQYVRESTGATEIGIEAVQSDEGPALIRLRVWGDVPGAGLDAELLEVFPHLEEADLSAEQMDGIVHTTVGRRLGHQLRLVALSDRDMNEARIQLLAELAAQGIEGEVDISISGDEGRREIRVEVQKQLGGSDGGATAPPTERRKHIKMRVRETRAIEEQDVDVRVDADR